MKINGLIEKEISEERYEEICLILQEYLNEIKSNTGENFERKCWSYPLLRNSFEDTLTEKQKESFKEIGELEALKHIGNDIILIDFVLNYNNKKESK